MENLKNAFTILYLISSSDGEVDSSELDLILSYLKENSQKSDFDHRQLTGSLIFLSKEQSKQTLEKTALAFKNNSTDKERKDLLSFALKIVMSDGRIAAEEIRMFNILGKVWDINIDEFIRSTLQ